MLCCISKKGNYIGIYTSMIIKMEVSDMDNFELYMIDTLKIWSDKLRHEKDINIRWMEKNVLAELMSVLVNYETNVKEPIENELVELPFTDDTVLLNEYQEAV